MDIAELAPAMVALGQVFQLAHQEANGDRSKLTVNVHAFRGGSFGVDLDLCVGLTEQIKQLFGSDLKDAQAIVAIIFGSRGLAGTAAAASAATAIGLFRLVRWLRGRKPASVEEVETAAGRTMFNITVNNEVTVQGSPNTVVVLPETLRLLQSEPARAALERAVRPLRSPGVNLLKTREAPGGSEQVTYEVVAERDDLPAFETRLPPSTEQDALLDDRTQEGVYLVRKPDLLKPETKWRLCLDSKDPGIQASIHDEAFLARIRGHEIKFGFEDAIRVRLRTVQHRGADGRVESTHTVEEVLQVLPLGPATQKSLFPPPPNQGRKPER